MKLLLSALITFLATTQENSTQNTDAVAAVVPASQQADDIAIIEVHSTIDPITAHSIKRRIEQATKDGASAIVIELDTPGGDLEAMLDICRFIKQDAPNRTIAWINPEAYSAGAIIALATEDIVMVPGARMGDAAPIAGIPGAGMLKLPTTERAKIEAPLLAEVVDSARLNNYDEKLVQSFVSVRFALWEIEERNGTGRLFVDANEYQSIFGEPPPLDRARGSEPTTPSLDSPITPETELSVADVQDRVSGRVLPTAEEADLWQLREQVVGDEELLIVDSNTALRYGLASAVLPDDNALQQHFAASNVNRYSEQWSEHLVRFLTSWPVRFVLIAILVIGFFLEIAAPGTSVFGAAALGALVVLLGAPLLVGMASWWEVLLILIGLALIAVELVVIPGVGIPGILGAICLLVGLVGVFVTADYGTPQANNQITTALVAIVAATLFGGVIAWWIARRTGGFWLFKQMVLDAQSGVPATQAGSIAKASTSDLIGRTGLATTDLRPSGRVEIDGTLYSARSTVGWINEDSPVKVVNEFAGDLEVELLEQNDLPDSRTSST